jgi:hypothetical protein
MKGGTVEIRKDEWTPRLNEFSAVHRGWLISAEYASPAGWTQGEMYSVPLISVSYEPEGTGAIRVCAGRSPSEHVAHVVDAPRRVWIEQTVEGAESALAIESSDGSRCTVRFKTAALPETVDSVAGWP